MSEDLDHILGLTGGLWDEIRGKRLFITGGTGFFGRWLLESLACANEAFDLQASALVLTREPSSFERNAPHLASNPAIRFHRGDIRDFSYPEGEFSHIIHAAATSAVATFKGEDPLVKFDTVVGGTRRVLDFALRCNASKFLLTSSGAVYGKQPSGITHISEEYCGAPDPLDANSVWGESKRAAELLCARYARKYGIETKIARCFSFLGPHLQLDIHYAAGNFIRDGLKGGPILVKGDGTPYRSYLYATDLVVWLWTVLFKGKTCRAYNVGSEEETTIASLANTVARGFPQPVGVSVAGGGISSDTAADRYVPSTRRAQKELGLRQTVSLAEAVKRTISFNRARSL